MKKVIGIGVILQTLQNTYLFQERDNNTHLQPGRIAAFGGGIEHGENIYECALREMYEELKLTLDANQLESIGEFESHNESNMYIQMFLTKNVDSSKLTLQEGRRIRDLSLEEALQDEKVTDFTKEVLEFVQKMQ